MDTPNAGKTWSSEESEQLVSRYTSGLDPEEIATTHGRSVNAVLGKLVSLGLLIARGEGYHHVDPTPWITFAEVRATDRKNRDENQNR